MTTAPGNAEPPKGKAWHNLSAEDILAQLRSSATGLSASETAQCLAANGPNELKEGKRTSHLQIFLGQFKSLIIWVRIVAGVISGLLGEVVDTIVATVLQGYTPHRKSTAAGPSMIVGTRAGSGEPIRRGGFTDIQLEIVPRPGSAMKNV